MKTRKGIMQPVEFENGRFKIYCALTANERRYIRNYRGWDLVSIFRSDDKSYFVYRRVEGANVS